MAVSVAIPLIHRRFAIPVNPVTDWIRVRRMEWSPGRAGAGVRVARLHLPSSLGAWRLRDRPQGEPQQVGSGRSDQGVPAIGTRGTRRRDGLRCFREGARALIDFQRHPSIVAYGASFRARGTAYLVVGNVDGQPLAEVLRERGCRIALYGIQRQPV